MIYFYANVGRSSGRRVLLRILDKEKIYIKFSFLRESIEILLGQISSLKTKNIHIFYVFHMRSNLALDIDKYCRVEYFIRTDFKRDLS